jgi:hypothetical protein
MMRNAWAWLWASAVMAACGSGAVAPADAGSKAADAQAADASIDSVDPANVAWCQGKTQFLYDPAGAQGLTAFPDDYYTVDDPTRATGLRVAFDPAAETWIAATPKSFQSTYDDLSTLDGWGTNAGIVLRFSAPVANLPSGATSVQSPAVLLVDLDTPQAERVPFELQPTDEGQSVILWPMRPLRPGHRHGVLVTRQWLAQDGGCIAPSAALRLALTGHSLGARMQRLEPRLHELLEKTQVAVADVSAAVVFTTQRTTDVSVAVAQDVAGRKFAWKQAMQCQALEKYRLCNGTFLAHDYTDGRVVKDGKPVAEYELQVAAWLPLKAQGLMPTVVFGHGLGGDRTQAEALGDLAAPEGIATVAIDAVGHGQHPGAVQGSKLQTVFGFFGVNVATQGVDALALRDHWRQSTYDKLQLLQLLKQAGDLDGDGQADVRTDQLMYLGVSLGGIMGPELLALSPDLRLGVLSVPGGRVSSIIADPNGQFAAIVYALKPDGTTDGDVDRYFPALQTLIDAGDAASYAPFVLRDRLPGSGVAVPSLLLGMVIGDDTVPNSANRALARAFDVPLIAPVLQPVGLIPPAPATPFSGNVAGGQATAGLFQFDRITRIGNTVPEKAEHGNMPRSQEALTQDLHFVQSWLKTGTAEILDPYATLKTPPLQP